MTCTVNILSLILRIKNLVHLGVHQHIYLTAQYCEIICLVLQTHIAGLTYYMYVGSGHAGLEDLKLGDASSGIGYTYKCLGAGFWALRQSDFRTALEAIVFEAGDADTNGAVAGALLGCKLGFDNLPKLWLHELINRQWMDNMIIR